MQKLVRFILVIIGFSTITSCGKYRYTSDTLLLPFTEIDTLTIISHKKVKRPEGVILLIASYDSLYDITKELIIGPLTKKKYRVVEVQKYAYNDFIMRSGTDAIPFYIDNITDGFQYYRQEHLGDSTLPFAVLGINEGALITPQLVFSLRADVAAVVNPHFQPFQYLLNDLIAQTDNSQLQQRVNNMFYVRNNEELFAWLHLLEISEPSDRTLAGKSTKYWKSYFSYDPMPLWSHLQVPVYSLIFSSYLLHTPTNQAHQRELSKRKPFRNSTAPGEGFHQKDYKEIEKWLLATDFFQNIEK